MQSCVARILIVATGFSACLATDSLWATPPSPGPQPAYVATASPRPDGLPSGLFLDETDDRSEEEEREDDRPLLVSLGADPATPVVSRPPIGRDGGQVRPGRQPAPSPASIRGPPRRA